MLVGERQQKRNGEKGENCTSASWKRSGACALAWRQDSVRWHWSHWKTRWWWRTGVTSMAFVSGAIARESTEDAAVPAHWKCDVPNRLCHPWNDWATLAEIAFITREFSRKKMTNYPGNNCLSFKITNSNKSTWLVDMSILVRVSDGDCVQSVFC